MKTLPNCTFAVLVTLLNPSQLVLAQVGENAVLPANINTDKDVRAFSTSWLPD